MDSQEGIGEYRRVRRRTSESTGGLAGGHRRGPEGSQEGNGETTSESLPTARRQVPRPVDRGPFPESSHHEVPRTGGAEYCAPRIRTPLSTPAETRYLVPLVPVDVVPPDLTLTQRSPQQNSEEKLRLRIKTEFQGSPCH